MTTRYYGSKTSEIDTSEQTKVCEHKLKHNLHSQWMPCVFRSSVTIYCANICRNQVSDESSIAWPINIKLFFFLCKKAKRIDRCKRAGIENVNRKFSVEAKWQWCTCYLMHFDFCYEPHHFSFDMQLGSTSNWILHLKLQHEMFDPPTKNNRKM